jgi:hypothetical protein
MKEPRRIKPVTLITELDISTEFQKGPRARFYEDAVAIGFNPIVVRGPGGAETVVETKPFQIPLGAIITPYFDNLLAGGRNIGATRVASGALRSPQVEWAIGEAAGLAASFCGGAKISVHALRDNPRHLRQLHHIMVRALSIPIYWYDDVKPDDPDFAEAQIEPFRKPEVYKEAKNLHYHK